MKILRTSISRHSMRFGKNAQGVAMVEFAICAPILMLLLLGSLEGSRFLIINQKQEKIAFTVADVVAQSTDLTTTGIDQLLAATQDMMDPFTFGANGMVLITSVTKNTGQNPVVNWRYSGGGQLTGVTSAFGSVGAAAVLPAGFTLNDRDNIIIAEVFYRFAPIYSSQLFGQRTLYKMAIYKPRLGELTRPPA